MRGWKEEGTITPPFDMTVVLEFDGRHLVLDSIDRLAQIGAQGVALIAQLAAKTGRTPALNQRERPGFTRDAELALACGDLIRAGAPDARFP